MVNFTVDQVHSLMHKTDQIRNICVIAHVDHGKTTLIDSLLQAAGLISKEKAGSARYLDAHRDSKERGITIKSSGVTLYFTLDESEYTQNQEEDTKETPYLVNLIDSPGHVDFSSEVTAALRVTDGAIVVVDCIEGVCVQTETVLRQAISERIKPVLFLNKLDRVFLERDEDLETSFHNFAKAIESANVIISTYKDDLLGDVQVHPVKGTVAFGSGYFGWAFTLDQFAAMYASKFGVTKDKLLSKLWGDNFYDPTRKKWTKKSVNEEGKKLERGFCRFVLKPIRELTQAVMNDDLEKVSKILKSQGVHFEKEMHELRGKDLLKKVMKAWLPAERCLLTLVTRHLPNPKVAQKYRVHNLYDGPMDDEAANAIRTCDPEGPLMLYVSKMIPSSESGRFIAFGRVFSGTVKPGQMVHIQGQNYTPGSKTDLFVKKIQRTLMMLGQKSENLVDCPCGSIVGLVGVDSYLLKSGTITTIEEAHNFKTMKYSVSPVVQVAVEPKNPSDLSKLVEGLKRLAKYDPLVQVFTAKTGEHIVAGAGELHLDICLKDLVEDFMNGAPIKKSDPIVQYCETIGDATAQVCASKSPNKLNRVFMTAEPLDKEFCQAVESGIIRPDDDFKARARRLVEDFKWDPNYAKKIWSFGCPPDAICNVLVDSTKGVQLLNEVKDSVVGAFSQASTNGLFIDGMMRGCRFNLMDMKVHSDPAHRGVGQLMPATKRAIYACQIKSKPKILEPVYTCTITTSADTLSGVYATLNARRGSIESQEDRIGTPLTVVKATLPVSESFGFTELLRKNTSGKAFPQMTFSHWEVVSGDLYDKSSNAYEIVRAIRSRQGMKEELPVFDHYHDKI